MAQVKVMHNIQMQNNNFPSTVTKQAGISTSDLKLTSECDSHVGPKEVCACWLNYICEIHSFSSNRASIHT